MTNLKPALFQKKSITSLLTGLMSCVVIGLVPTFTLAQPQSSSKEQTTEQALDKNIGTPAVWRMRDEDSDIWLLGTFHILPPELDWRTDNVIRAINSSDTLYLEADIESPGAQLSALKILMTEGFNPRGVKLTKLLGGARADKLRQICKDLNLPIAAIDDMRPWQAYITITTQFIVAKGYDPSSGVDSQLSKEVKASGKPIKYLETAKDQLSIFTTMSTERELKLLASVLDSWGDADEEFETLYEAWRTGDVESMDTLINASMRDELPELYEAILVNRNRNWVEQLDEVMKGSGNFLVAVGAGHYVGDDSVIAMMRKRGYTIERVAE